MKRIILSKSFSLLIMFFMMLSTNNVSLAVSESIYFWDRYEVKTQHEINRHPTFTTSHAGWGEIEWYISVDDKGDIWFTKGSKQIHTYSYPAGTYINAYDIVEDSNFINAMGKTFKSGDSFNYSEAIKKGTNIRMSYWSGPIYLIYQDDEWLHFCRHEMYYGYDNHAFVTANVSYIKDKYKDTISSYSRSIYPDDGVKDGYWYVYSHSVTNNFPTLSLTNPVINTRAGNQDSITITGNTKDLDIGQTIVIKYSMGNILSQNINLIQPTSIISNGQAQSFQGYIKLNGLSSGSNKLELWAEDNKGAKSNIVEVPIITFSTLENVLSSLKSYAYKSGEPQILVINSNTTITQSTENDNLINQIKQELQAKNVKLFFIGKDGVTENYIKKLLQ